MTQEKQAWVISVKLGKGCYRHLQFPKTRTLEELADVILQVFNFDNDHAHAFFMDNRVWSDDAYYLTAVDLDEEFPHTEDYNLEVLSLRQKFKFLFDFGDSWEFDCQVLREVSDDGEIYVIRSVGQPPEQYPEYDEDEWEFYDE